MASATDSSWKIATTSYPQDGTTYGGKSLKVNKCIGLEPPAVFAGPS
jgi:hypothetical protein